MKKRVHMGVHMHYAGMTRQAIHAVEGVLATTIPDGCGWMWIDACTVRTGWTREIVGGPYILRSYSSILCIDIYTWIDG